MDNMDFANELTDSLTIENLYEKTVRVKELETQFKTAKDELDAFRMFYLQKMRNENLTKQENDDVSVTIKEAYESCSVDTEKLKADGLYDKYTKKKSVDASLVVKIKKRING